MIEYVLVVLIIGIVYIMYNSAMEDNSYGSGSDSYHRNRNVNCSDSNYRRPNIVRGRSHHSHTTKAIPTFCVARPASNTVTAQQQISSYESDHDIDACNDHYMDMFVGKSSATPSVSLANPTATSANVIPS